MISKLVWYAYIYTIKCHTVTVRIGSKIGDIALEC